MHGNVAAQNRNRGPVLSEKGQFHGRGHLARVGAFGNRLARHFAPVGREDQRHEVPADRLFSRVPENGFAGLVPVCDAPVGEEALHADVGHVLEERAQSLLALTQGVFRALAFGGIADHGDDAVLCAGGLVRDQRHRGLGPDVLSILGPSAVLDRSGLARRGGRVHGRGETREVVRVDELGRMVADQLRRFVPEQVAGRAGDVGVRPIECVPRDHVAGVLGQHPVAQLAGAQRLLGASALGAVDVGDDGPTFAFEDERLDAQFEPHSAIGALPRVFRLERAASSGEHVADALGGPWAAATDLLRLRQTGGKVVHAHADGRFRQPAPASKGHPRVIGHDDPALTVEHHDLRRQRTEHALEKAVGLPKGLLGPNALLDLRVQLLVGLGERGGALCDARLQLVARLDQRQLGALAVRDVQNDALVVGDLPVWIAAHPRAIIHPDRFARLAEDPVFLREMLASLAAVPTNLADHAVKIVRMNDVRKEDATTDEVRNRVSELRDVLADVRDRPSLFGHPEKGDRRTAVDDLVEFPPLDAVLPRKI